MQVAIEIEFPYVRHLGTPQQAAGKLTLPLLEQMVPLKPVTDALGLAWVQQFRKVQAKVLDDPKHWVARSVVAPSDTQQRKQLCVALRTLQVFLDSLAEGRSKDPELLRHFKAQLVPSIFAKVQQVAEGVSQPADAVDEPHVIVINRPLETPDRIRKALQGFLLPEDIEFVATANELRIGVEREVETLTGARKKVVREVCINDFNNPVMLRMLEQLLVENKGKALGPRQLYQRGYNKDASILRLPERTEHKVVGDEVGGIYPKSAIEVIKHQAKTIYAPWAASAA